jgi:hypothetical protein
LIKFVQYFRERVTPYTDNLNSWLGQILQRDAPQLNIEIVDVETTGNLHTFILWTISSSFLDLDQSGVTSMEKHLYKKTNGKSLI